MCLFDDLDPGTNASIRRGCIGRKTSLDIDFLGLQREKVSGCVTMHCPITRSVGMVHGHVEFSQVFAIPGAVGVR